MSETRHLVALQVLVPGAAAGEVLASDEMLSFWGGVDPGTGVVIDRRHPLHGRALPGSIVVLPRGRGSSTGSYVLLDLLAAGKGPAGILLRAVDEIIALGVLVHQEFNGATVPVCVLDEDDFSLALGAAAARVFPDGRVVLHA